MGKCLWVQVAVVILGLTVVSSCAWAGITNGGFESGLTGWTVQTSNDGTNLGWSGGADVTNNLYHSGAWSLFGYASVVGDYSEWSERDWSRTYVRSAPMDLSGYSSIRFYLRGFQSYEPSYGWGFGQNVQLLLEDDQQRSISVGIIDNNEQPWMSLYRLGKYTTSTGADAQEWYCFDVPLSVDGFGEQFEDMNLANAQIGFAWEADNWNSSSQSLYSSAAIDDVSLKVVPEPAGLLSLVGGLGLLLPILRRRVS